MAKKNSEPQTIEGNATKESQALATSTPAEPRAIAHRKKHSVEADPFLSIIERAIMTPNFDVSKLQQLLDVRERWEKNEAAKAYTVAINKFKQDPPTIIKNRAVGYESKKTGDTVGYSHATLDQVCDAVIKGLSDVGISHKWRTEQPDGKVRVTCVLRHEMGGTDEATLEGPPDTSGTKNMIQAIGSTVTYLERYTLLAVTGLAVAGTDTDGTSRPSLDEVVCPACNFAGAFIVGKPEYGGGFVCFKKKGGCGATFERLPGTEHAVEGEPEQAPEQSQSQAKTKKFAGTVIDAQRVDAGDHQVLVLKLKYCAKRKGKDGKWSTVTEETIVVAEQSNFMRLLERSRETKIEVECSQQAGGKGKAYWRIEKLISGGTEPPAGETKAAPAETKPAEGKTMPKATAICECGHAAGNHAYGADACTQPDCKCQSFRVKTTQTRNSGPVASAEKSTSSNSSSHSAAQPASSPAQPATSTPAPVIVGQPPVVAKVQRNLVMAGGKKKAVEWLQVRGKVRGFGWSKDNHGVYQLLRAPTVATTSKRSEYIAVVLEGLPPWPENQKGAHDLFLCWHKSLFECMKTLKVGDTFIFCYEQETVADGRTFNAIEDAEFVNGTEYLNGKPAQPAPGEVSK
jgi:hypothetical protein